MITYWQINQTWSHIDKHYHIATNMIADWQIITYWSIITYCYNTYVFLGDNGCVMYEWITLTRRLQSSASPTCTSCFQFILSKKRLDTRGRCSICQFPPLHRCTSSLILVTLSRVTAILTSKSNSITHWQTLSHRHKHDHTLTNYYMLTNNIL
jgi:hypothetical protein